MILISINEGLIAPQLPDSISKFSNQTTVEIDGQLYFVAEYLGTKKLISDYDVNTYLESVKVNEPGNAIRKITVAAFYTRLDEKLPTLLALSDQLAGEGNYALKADLMRIDKSEFVYLDDPRLKPGLQATGQFTDEELALIFQDGQPEEVPELLK